MKKPRRKRRTQHQLLMLEMQNFHRVHMEAWLKKKEKKGRGFKVLAG